MHNLRRTFSLFAVALALAIIAVPARADLSTAQRQAVLVAVQADSTANGYRQAGDTISLQAWLNAASAPTVTVWRTDAPVVAIIDSINWALYTPNDAADSTTLYLNRAILAQTKQMNLQLMLQGRTTLDCTKANVRSGLRDAVILLPTGAGGANTSPGGVSGATTLAACTRTANRVEAILAGGTATTGTTTANLLVFEGLATQADASWLVNN